MVQNNLHNPVASENEQKFHFCINFNTVDSKQINECSKIALFLADSEIFTGSLTGNK